MIDSEITFRLLVKVTDCCEQNRIPYYLGFYPMRLALLCDTLPEGIMSLELFVPAEYIPQLCLELGKDPAVAIESMETNPGFTDTCVNVTDRNSTYFDLFHPTSSRAPGYTVVITPIIPAPGKKKEETRKFLKARYSCVRHNLWINKFQWKFLRFFKPRARKYAGTLSKDQVHLYRYKYRKYCFPKAYFSEGCRMMLNGHSFSAVRCPQCFLSLYYKKKLETYRLTSRINTKRYISQPEIPFVQADFRRPIMIAVYTVAIRFMNRLIRKQFSFIKDQKRFFFRTADRFELVDLYAPLKEACAQAHAQGDWEQLETLLEPYIKMTMKYREEKMPFAFDYDMYDYLTDFLYYTGKNQHMLQYLMAERDKAFAYLDYVNSYNPNKACF